MDRVEAVKIAFEERISERLCEQFGVIEVSKSSSQEHVEIVKNYPSGDYPRSHARKCGSSQNYLSGTYL